MTDDTAKRQIRFLMWIVGLLLGACIALASSGCTIWAMKDDIIVDRQAIIKNSMNIETMAKNDTDVKIELIGINTKLTNLGLAIARIESMR